MTVTTETHAPITEGRGYPAMFRRATRLFERNVTVYKRGWMVIFSGFFEPLFYLIAVGFGVGSLIGDVTFINEEIAFPLFVAPGMLAASCMNGAVNDSFMNVFFKLNFQGTYEGILATPLGVRDIALGEMLWAQFRGVIYAAGFLVVMLVLGLIRSPWAVLALPAAFLVSLAFSAMGLAMTSFASKIQHFDLVFGLIVMPMFLLSGTMFPISVYPEPFQWVVRISPLYHAADLLRSLTTGLFSAETVVHVVFLTLMIFGGLALASRRLERRILK